MKNKEEIEQLAWKFYVDKDGIVPNTYESEGFTNGYAQCQKDNTGKKYTEADIKKAIELARETESVRRGALSEDWDDIEKHNETDIINLLNKQA